jgi:hypothetical protein
MPCRPPCWEGVVPGNTTVDEAFQLWSRSEIISHVEVVTLPMPALNKDGFLTWLWANGEEGGDAIYGSVNGVPTVDMISPRFSSFSGDSISIGDVIGAFGEPEYVQAVATGYTDEVTKVIYSLFLYFPRQGFVIGINVHRESIITPDLPIAGITFFPISTYQELTQRFSPDYPELFTQWNGYQPFLYYCRDNADGQMCNYIDQ